MKKLLFKTLLLSFFITSGFGQCGENQIELKKDKQRDWVKDFDNLVIIYGKQKENISLLKKYFYTKEKPKTCISLDSLKMLRADLEKVFINTSKPNNLVNELRGAINTVISRNPDFNPQQKQKSSQNGIDSMESEVITEGKVSSHELEQSKERILVLEKDKCLWLWISIIASIGFIGTIILYLFDRKKFKEQIALKNEIFSDAQKEYFDSEETEIKRLRTQYANLQKEKNNLEEKYNDLKNSLSSISTEKQVDKEVAMSQNSTKIATQEVTPKQFFLSIPTPADDGLGIFRDMRQTQANPTSSFYRFELESDETKAKFWFLDNPNTIQSAVIYPETYINPVCDYEGFKSNAKRIVTKTPGTAIKVGDSWKVLKKAKIRFD